MPLDAKLVVVGGDVKTTEIKLKLPTAIGRGRGTGIVLPHPLVSRQHCELYESDGQLMVRDLGSLNGTFVNNERITEAPLAPGELLTIGTVTFRAVYEAGAEAGPAAQESPGEKTIKIEKASAKTLKPTAMPTVTDDDADFDFEKPLMPVEEEATPSRDDARVTERLERVKNKPKNPKNASVPPPSKPEDATVDFTKWEDKEDEDKEDNDKEEDEEEENVKSASDDDLNDFLKSLGK